MVLFLESRFNLLLIDPQYILNFASLIAISHFFLDVNQPQYESAITCTFDVILWEWINSNLRSNLQTII